MAVLIEHYEHIDSGERDLTKYPARADFRVDLSTPIRDIHSVEILGLILPNLDNILDEPYLLLDIQELNNTLAGTPNQSVTAVLHLQNPINGPNYSHVAMCRKVAERSPMVYRPPKAKIHTLTVKIKKSDGTLCNLGQDTSSVLRQNQISLHLKFMIDLKDPSLVISKREAVPFRA